MLSPLVARSPSSDPARKLLSACPSSPTESSSRFIPWRSSARRAPSCLLSAPLYSAGSREFWSWLKFASTLKQVTQLSPACSHRKTVQRPLSKRAHAHRECDAVGIAGGDRLLSKSRD